MANESVSEFEIETDVLSVLAWVDAPVPFDGLTDGARALRCALREELSRLSAEPGEALHATFTGQLRPGSDLENVLFYNVDSGASVFGPSTRYGVRFELGGGRMPAPRSGRVWRCCYEYRLAPAGRAVKWWRSAYALGRFAAELPAIRGIPSATAVWYAVRCGQWEAWNRLPNPADRFQIDLRLRVPGDRALTPDLLKPLLDGVTAAFQSHGDRVTAPAIADVLAARLGVEPADLVEMLLSDERAVLGRVERLVYAYRGGIKWNPSDHRCVAATIELEQGAGGYVLSGMISPAEVPEGLDADEDIAANPLRWQRTPIPWERYRALSNPPVLQILYTQLGGGGQPGAAIAEVNVSENEERVTIELVERELAGTLPNGTGVGRTLQGIPGCLEVPLTAPVGGRPVIDPTADVPRPAITSNPDPDSPDRAALSLLAAGCPRWEQP
jgi:hypothetical protein